MSFRAREDPENSSASTAMPTDGTGSVEDGAQEQGGNEITNEREKEEEEEVGVEGEDLEDEWMMGGILSDEDESEEERENEPPGRKRGRPRSQLDNVSTNHELKRLKPVIDGLKIHADDLGKTVTEICGRVIWVSSDRMIDVG